MRMCYFYKRSVLTDCGIASGGAKSGSIVTNIRSTLAGAANLAPSVLNWLNLPLVYPINGLGICRR